MKRLSYMEILKVYFRIFGIFCMMEKFASIYHLPHFKTAVRMFKLKWIEQLSSQIN